MGLVAAVDGGSEGKDASFSFSTDFLVATSEVEDAFLVIGIAFLLPVEVFEAYF